MKLLIAGDHPALQRSFVEAAISAGHTVRVLSRHPRLGMAERQGLEWAVVSTTGAIRIAPQMVEGIDAAVVIDAFTAGSRASDDAGLAQPVIDAASRGGVGRLVQVVPAGEASRGERVPDEHGERRFPGGLVTVRTSTVYGIGDDPLTRCLIMMRSLPAVPVLSDAHVVWPLWHADLTSAVVSALGVPATELVRTVALNGPDPITHAELYERIAALTDRRPVPLPVPDFIAAQGSRIAEALGAEAAFDIWPLASEGHNVSSQPPSQSDPDWRAATGLDDGLRRLIHDLEEVTPADGVGTVEVKRFFADIHGSHHGAEPLLRLFRARFKEVMPIGVGVEPAAPQVELIEGETLTLALPGRGHVQIRVEEASDRQVVVGTVRGHAVAGVVRFSTQTLGDAVRFEVMTCDAAANAFDWTTLTLGGARVQDANWTKVVDNVARLAGGRSDGVSTEARRLSSEEAAAVQRWLEDVVQRRRAAVKMPAVLHGTGAAAADR